MFTDTHSHLHFAHEFPDIDQILGRAQLAEVTRQIIVGCTPKDSYQALHFVKKHADKKLWSTLGVHPHNANLLNDQILARYRELAQSEAKIVALGEMGLDYFRNFQPRAVQQHAFKMQLILAKELNMPAIVHVRDAWEDALQILEETGNTKVILHCFSADLALAERCWSNGYYTSFSGVVTYPGNDYLRAVAEVAPAVLLLLETDCPYLTPQSFRGRRNEPAFIVETARELAKVRGVDLEEIGQLTTENAQRVFGFD